MAGYQCILVAIGAIDEADKLIRRAQELSAKKQVHLVHVEEHPITGYGDITANNHIVNERSIRQHLYPKLQALAESFTIPNDKVHLTFGDPGEVVHTLAKKLHCDLIITGSHGKHGLKLLLGSTSNEIYHGAKTDILSVYSGEQ